MKPRAIVLYWLLLLVPTLLIGGISFNLLRHEQARIARASEEAARERAAGVVESIQLAIEELRRQIGENLALLPASRLEASLREWEDTNPLIRHGFVWHPRRGLELPPADLQSDDEKAFVLRYDALFSGRVAWPEPGKQESAAAPAGTSRLARAREEFRKAAASPRASLPAALPAAHATEPPLEPGWLPWFWEDQMYLLSYVRRGDEVVYGVEIEMAAVLARLLPALPAEAPEGFVVALLDGHGRTVHQTTADSRVGGDDAVAQIPIGPSLPHWQVAVFRTATGALPITGGAFRLLSFLLVGIFVAAILAGGSLLLWQAQRHLRDARQKTTFVSNVSHELKTPLTTIRMYAELLREGRVADAAKRDHYLDVMARESSRLTRLVNNILDFARLEQGRKKYRLEDFDLGAAVCGVLDAQHLRLESAGLALERRLPVEPTPVRLDRDVIEQVLLNLLDNAIKYAASGNRVTVELARAGGVYSLSVMDRGPGIPSGHRPHIFESFYRVDDSLTSSQPGSGLGLSISKRMLRGLGGDLTYSDREGGGAVFVARIPASATGAST